ncbi:MAG: hypothetical protein ACFE0M_11590 [Marivirga sp.]
MEELLKKVETTIETHYYGLKADFSCILEKSKSLDPEFIEFFKSLLTNYYKNRDENSDPLIINDYLATLNKDKLKSLNDFTIFLDCYLQQNDFKPIKNSLNYKNTELLKLIFKLEELINPYISDDQKDVKERLYILRDIIEFRSDLKKAIIKN